MSKRRRIKEQLKEELSQKPTKKNAGSIPAVQNWNSMINWFVVLVLFLPVIFSRSAIDPAITVRYIFLSFFMFLFILFFSSRKRLESVSITPLSKAVFFLGAGFAGWGLISLINAINPGAAFYETARSFLNIMLLFLIMVMVQQEESKILKLCKALMILSIIQSFVGILQYYDIAFTELPGNFKPYGLMANRNLFGSAQTFLLPFTLFVLYKTTGSWKWITILAITGIITSLVISQTRSAWVASLLLFAVSFILVIIFSKPNRKKWLIGYGVGAIAAALLVFILLKTGEEEGLTKSLQERATSISNPYAKQAGQSAETISDRFKIWNKTTDVLKDHPVTGVGWSNWKLVVLSYGSTGISWEEGFYVPDRAHNVYLQVASETGIPGAVLYFGMWILVAIIAFKTILKPQTEDRRILAILMLAGLVAYASDNMFSFANERIEHTLFISLMGGIILGIYIHSVPASNLKKLVLNRGWLIASLVIVAFNLFIGFKKHSFEVHMNLAEAYANEGNNQYVIEEVRAGKSALVTVDPEGRPIENYSSIAYKNMKDFKNALAEGNRARKYNPNSGMIYNNIGTIHTELGEYEKAIENYRHALRLTPRNVAAQKNLAYNYFQTKNYAGCVEILEKLDIKREPFLQNLLNDARSRLAERE